MSNNETAYSQLDEMPTEKLESLLSLDIEVPGVHLEPETILHILEVIQAREEADGTALTLETTAAAWKNFNENYRSAEVAEHLSSAPKRTHIHLKRLVVTLAAAAILIVGGAVAASASGFDLWGTLVQWASQTFSLNNDMRYGDMGKAKAVLPCKDLQQMLNVDGIKEKLVPTWLPNGFEQVSCDQNGTPNMSTYQATYRNGKAEITIQIFAYRDGQQATETYEKLPNGYETYKSNNDNYYIAKNSDGSIIALWNTKNYECNLHGYVTVAEMKEIINSISEG